MSRQEIDRNADKGSVGTRDEWNISDRKFRLITDTLPQSVWTAGPDGSIDYYNRRFEEFAGEPPEAAKDGMWVKLVHPDDVSVAEVAWRYSVDAGQPYEATFRVRDRNGEYRWTLARGLPARDPDGAVVKWVGTNTDIHDKVLAEQALREGSRRKDEFLAMLAHELRNPLVPIGAGAEMLSMADCSDSRVAQVSDMIRRQIKHVTSLIDDLLDVSRVTQGRIVLERHAVDLKRVVQDSAEQVRPLLESHRHQLMLQVPQNAMCVCGDYNRLVQVVSNLLANAAKYTPDGGLIEVTVELIVDQVLVRVKDNGAGMEPELLIRAFELFQQGARSSARTEGGLGIGLALVKSLVEQHYGTVEASSLGLGKGSVLTVRLPHLDRAEVPRIIPDSNKQSVHAQHRKVLLVDDNPDVAESVGMMLQILGHDVSVEHEAQGAILRANAETFDSCILDIGLPGMDGYQLARELRRFPGTQNAVLIAHTGYGQSDDKKLSSEAGFNYHLVKPAPISELERVLATEPRG